MSKRFFITKKQFKKMYSMLDEINSFIYLSKCFSSNYLEDICEVRCIVPVLKYIEKNTDNLICMLTYIETKDNDLKDIFD